MSVQRKRMQSVRRGDVIADGIASTGLWLVTKVRRRPAAKTVRLDVTNIFDHSATRVDGAFSDWREVFVS